MKPLAQSFSWWCFRGRGIAPEDLMEGAAKIGYEGVDLLREPLWPMAARHGLKITAISGHRTLEEGLNRRAHASRIEKELRTNIAKAEKRKIPILICFSGNRRGQDDEIGLKICAETLRRVAPMAANAGVTLAMELLNSKVNHPDYQCDHTAWGVRLCKLVDSPAVKLLYDIYHMQIMEGDIIRTIEQEHRHFAHYHTAGNPGRCQPDARQEINYPAIYAAIAATGYRGFVSHEFIPKGNPLDALARAHRDCLAATSS